MNVKLEYMGEFEDVPGSEIYKVEAIHVTTTTNKRKYTEKELILAARSLSFRPLNINHNVTRLLPFNEGGILLNTTLVMEYDSEKKAVVGKIRISDTRTIHSIENKNIDALSIEQHPFKGESCGIGSCEQHGVIFIGLALLEKYIEPGDVNTIIQKETTATKKELISECIISQEQRDCKKCTDYTICAKCSHSEADNCMERCLSDKKADGKTIDDQAIAICLSECGKSRDEQWVLYEKLKKKLAIFAHTEKEDDTKDGDWITVRGAKIFIPKGSDKDDVIQNHLNNLTQSKDDNKNQTVSSDGFKQTKTNESIIITADAKEVLGEHELGELSKGWNALPEKDRTLVTKLNIIDDFSDNLGTIDKIAGGYKIQINVIDDPNYSAIDVLRHEVGHAVSFNLQDNHSQKRMDFNEKVDSLPPLHDDIEFLASKENNNTHEETFAETYAIIQFLKEGGKLDDYRYSNINVNAFNTLKQFLDK